MIHRIRRPLAPALRVLLGLTAPATVAPTALAAQVWTVADAVEEALANHPALARATWATRASEEGASVARSAYFPTLRASTSGVRFEEPMVVAPLHAFDPTAPPAFSDALVRSRIALGFSVFDPARGPSVDGARAGASAATADREAVLARIIEGTVAAYSEVATARLVVDASARRQEALEAEVARADSAFQAGSAPRVESLRAGAALAEAEAGHASALAGLTAAERILARLTGRTALPAGAITTPRITESPADTARSGGAPELQAALAGLEGAQARSRAARRAFLPQVDLASSLDQFGAANEHFTHEWQLGLTVSLPLFLGGSRFGEARRRSAEVEAARARVEVVRMELDTERDRALSALTAAEGRVAAFTSAEVQYEEVVRVERLALSEGAAVQRDLLAAEAALFGVRADLARARADVTRAQLTLARVDGRLTLDWLRAHLEESPVNRRIRIALLVLIVGALGAAAWWLLGSREGTGGIEASGTIEATEAQLSFQASGRIVEVLVREGATVEEGDLLARVDTVELAAARRLAAAQVDAAAAGLQALERGSRPAEVAQAEAAAEAAEARHGEAVRERERAGRLHAGGAVSARVLEQARTAELVAEAGLREARERLTLVREGPRREEVDAARARLAQARAALTRAEAVLADARITAPFSGIVTVRYREPGEAVTPGAPVLALQDPDERWVRIYVREDRVGTVSLGQAAEITTDSWPDRVFRGTVDFIASEAEFTPRSVQTTDERTRLVYAVKVRIEGDEERALKPGLPADVRLDVP